jgi:hypothetical protein
MPPRMTALRTPPRPGAHDVIWLTMALPLPSASEHHPRMPTAMKISRGVDHATEIRRRTI